MLLALRTTSARAETLRAQIEASEDPESIDITSGWPAIYGEA